MFLSICQNSCKSRDAISRVCGHKNSRTESSPRYPPPPPKKVPSFETVSDCCSLDTIGRWNLIIVLHSLTWQFNLTSHHHSSQRRPLSLFPLPFTTAAGTETAAMLSDGFSSPIIKPHRKSIMVMYQLLVISVVLSIHTSSVCATTDSCCDTIMFRVPSSVGTSSAITGTTFSRAQSRAHSQVVHCTTVRMVCVCTMSSPISSGS